MTELERYFTYRCWKGLEERGKADLPEYKERLKYEIDVIIQMGFPGYFLVVADILDWARRKGIPTGIGRGSAAGALIAYSLGITHPEIDPIKYSLLFERFLSIDRMEKYVIDFPESPKEEFDNK